MSDAAQRDASRAGAQRARVFRPTGRTTFVCRYCRRPAQAEFHGHGAIGAWRCPVHGGLRFHDVITAQVYTDQPIETDVRVPDDAPSDDAPSDAPKETP